MAFLTLTHAIMSPAVREHLRKLEGWSLSSLDPEGLLGYQEPPAHIREAWIQVKDNLDSQEHTAGDGVPQLFNAHAHFYGTKKQALFLTWDFEISK